MRLVAYFSATGRTRRKAKKYAEELGADLFEIKPEIPYTLKDLNWMSKKSRTSVEMNNKSFRPKMKENTMDLSKYDTIYLGFPIWWYVAPTIVNTFLESYDFSGKTIYLFATSGSSGFGNTLEELKVSAPQADFKLWRINNKEL